MKFPSRFSRLGLGVSAALTLLCSLLPAAASAGTLAVKVEDWRSGAGLDGAYLRIYRESRGTVGFFRAGADGAFESPQLAAGRYYVTAGSLGYEAQAYDGVAYVLERDLGPALDQATLVAVPENGRVELSPMRLRQLARISGRILDAKTGEPIAGSLVRAYTSENRPMTGYGDAGGDGSFTLENLPPGTYYLLADGPGMRDLLVGGDEACTVRADDYRYYSACDPTRGTPFTVDYGQSIDAGEVRLPEEGRIRGTVRLADGGVSYSHVQIYNSSNRLQSDFYPPGVVHEWAFDLPVPGGGTYYLAASAEEHLVQIYDHLECITGSEPHCTDVSAGTAVTVAPGQSQSGIDFDLKIDRLPCRPSATTLCLNEGRFSVSGYHAAGPNGNLWDLHRAGRITEEAGYFTFFDEDNVELVVKVLDACDDFGSFWVFAAGLTDVNNILYVRDNWAAETRRYDAYGNRPFRPFSDTTSFQTCFAAPPGPGPEEAAAAAPAAAASAAAPLPAPAPGLVPNGCGSDPGASLCLGDRFAVEVEWTTAQGESGDGQPQPLTADTGFFHFFSPGNIEVVVKVLDACRADLGNRYWVFAAGLTDVAVTLKVTDTASGEQKIYLSPLGGLFQPILDLGAFATCP